MSNVIQLFQQPCQPEPETFPNLLRRLTDEIDVGKIAGVSIVISGYDGKVETYHSDIDPILQRK